MNRLFCNFVKTYLSESLIFGHFVAFLRPVLGYTNIEMNDISKSKLSICLTSANRIANIVTIFFELYQA